MKEHYERSDMRKDAGELLRYCDIEEEVEECPCYSMEMAERLPLVNPSDEFSCPIYTHDCPVYYGIEPEISTNEPPDGLATFDLAEWILKNADKVPAGTECGNLTEEKENINLNREWEKYLKAHPYDGDEELTEQKTEAFSHYQDCMQVLRKALAGGQVPEEMSRPEIDRVNKAVLSLVRACRLNDYDEGFNHGIMFSDFCRTYRPS
jgi:hypothetical protein